MKKEARPLHLQNQVQHYAWGAQGKDSFMAELLGVEDTGETLAEIWMGVHPSAPSKVIIDSVVTSLPEFIHLAPDAVLGRSVTKNFGAGLPFLFKVLSAEQALSIQVHPKKDLARRLHAKDPEHYPDENHKPELAIAVGQMDALVGFLPFEQIVFVLEQYPELAELAGPMFLADMQNLRNRQDSTLKHAIFRKFLAALLKNVEEDPVRMQKTVQSMTCNMREAGPDMSAKHKLFLDLAENFGQNDAGLLFVPLMRLFHLERGSGIFLPPGVPHAYLKGNIVECMANSDNVIRAGLTPKFRDTATLLEALDMELSMGDKAPQVLEVDPDCTCLYYSTPAREFEVSRIHLKKNSRLHIYSENKVSILLCLYGEGKLCWSDEGSAVIKKGDSFLLPATLKGLDLSAQTSLLCYRAGVPG